VTNHPSRGLALLALSLLPPVTIANAVAGQEATRSRPDPCPDEVEWSQTRRAAEDQIEQGSYHLDKMTDPSLREAVNQYWNARLRQNLAGLLELELSQSDEHLKVETKRLQKLLAEDAKLDAATWRVTPYSYWIDETNSAHVWVYSTVVLRLHGRCLEDGIVTEWVLLDGDWSTFPAGQLSHNAAYKGRPNRNYVPK
jgi:hypothetical protein